MSVIIEGDVRKVERQLGQSISIHEQPGLNKIRFECWDSETDEIFLSDWVTPSRQKYTLSRIHEAVYHARGRVVAKKQDMECAICGLAMFAYEIDHIESRGANGRDDRMVNLRAVHPKCHRRRHGERI